MDISNSVVGKYYRTKESMIFLTLVPMNKLVKLIDNKAYIFFLGKKCKYVSYIKFAFHNKNPQIKYIMKLYIQKQCEGPQINSK
jgi:hypothetical protein